MMRKKTLLTLSILIFFGLTASVSRNASTVGRLAGYSEIDSIYNVLNLGGSPLPGKSVFTKAMSGYRAISESNSIQSPTLSIIDFTLPSTEKRLWIIDLANGQVLHHSLVAHGKNSGDLFAREFSNKNDSYQSSLGFYLTGKTYTGKHGLSLKLHGLEPGINDKAESRAIVIHGADYVSEQYAKKVGRLGRSWGCPAIPVEQHKEIINLLAGGTCIFIYYPDEEYLSKSRFVRS